MQNIQMQNNLKAFYLPEWNEIPEVGLYLDQVVKFINHYTETYPGMAVTGSMISNYVKLKVVGKAQKKAYGRELVAHLLFVAVARTVLTMDQLRQVRAIIEEKSDLKSWYESFRKEMTECLNSLNGKEKSTVHAKDECSELLHNIAVTAAHKMYLDQFFSLNQEKNNEQNKED